MIKHTITYQDKEYVVNEPSIQIWTKLDFYKDILDDNDFVIKIISESTGLTEEQIMQADWFDILQVASGLSELLLNINDDFHPDFEFDGVKYKFIDLPNLTFGEFIDIDSFLQKNEAERKNQLNFLMALFYREVGEDGKVVKNDGELLQARAEKFKNLPVKYVHGALGFFLRLEKILQKPSLKFLVRLKWLQMKKKWNKVKTKVLQSIGGGLAFWRPSQMKTSQK
jgi:hypothetical protein